MTASKSEPDHDGANSPSEDELAIRLRRALTGPSATTLVERAPLLVVRASVGVGERRFLLDIDRGRMNVMETLPLLAPWNFAIKGSAAAWAAYWEPMPRPGWHDLFALSKRGEMSFEGDIHPFMAHLQFFKDLLALPRTGGTR